MKKYKNLLWISLIIFISATFAICYYNLNRNKIDVSVIVPIYNVEKYLDECLNSIENQTKKDGIEIICINDGSKDNSFEILKQHADKNNKIKIINQENKGVSVARNKGLDNAKGKYVMFVDSDDVIVPHAIEKLYEVAENYNVDIVNFNRKCFGDGENFNFDNISYDKSKIKVLTRDKNQNPFYCWGTIDTQGVVWNKFWKRSFIENNNLRFKEGAKFEDTLFDWIAFSQTLRVLENDNILYGYRVGREGSIMSDMNRNASKSLDNFLMIIEELANNRYRINFDDSDNWIVNRMFIKFDEIYNGLQNKNDKVYYSRKYLDLIDNFVNKYKVNLSQENLEVIEKLRSTFLV